MEDRAVCIDNTALLGHRCVQNAYLNCFSYSTQALCRFAAIYDGHEGSQAATYLAAYLHDEIKHGFAGYTAGHVQRCCMRMYHRLLKYAWTFGLMSQIQPC